MNVGLETNLNKWDIAVLKISDIKLMKTIHGVIIDDLVLTGFRALWRPDAANTQYSLRLYSKEAPTQVFFYEIWEIFKNIYFEEHLRRTASIYHI